MTFPRKSSRWIVDTSSRASPEKLYTSSSVSLQGVYSRMAQASPDIQRSRNTTGYTMVPVLKHDNCAHYGDVIMITMASQITSLTVVYSIVHSDADKRKYQNPASLAFVRGINRWPVNSPYKGPVTRKMFPFDDVIMQHALITIMHRWKFVKAWI